MSHTPEILRVYDLTDEASGYRVLVDRLWPRGLRKESLRLDRWAKEAAPSSDLRKWFSHDEAKFDKFRDLYRSELNNSVDAYAFAQDMAEILKEREVLLLYAAKSPLCNHAVILRDWLLEQISSCKMVE